MGRDGGPLSPRGHRWDRWSLPIAVGTMADTRTGPDRAAAPGRPLSGAGRLQLAGLAALVAVHAAVASLPHGDDLLQAAFSDLLYVAVDVIGLWACVRAARTPGMDRATRRVWLLFAASMAATLAGDLTWSWLELIARSEPYPSLVDVAYLASYPLQLLAVLGFPLVRRSRAERWKVLLDMLVTLVAGTMILWDLVLGPLAAASSGDLAATIVGVGYPVADIVLLFAVVRLTLLAGMDRSRRSITLLTASMCTYLVVDLIYSTQELQGTYVSGRLLDVGWTLAVTTLAAAALVQRFEYHNRSVAGVSSRLVEHGRSLLPYLVVAAAYGLIVVELVAARAGAAPLDGSIGLPGLVLGSLAITGLVVLRQFASVRERVDAEMVARRLEARFRALVQSGRDLILIVLADSEITYASPSIGTVLGRRPEGCLGRPLASLVVPEDATTLQRTLLVLAAGSIVPAEDAAVTSLRLRFVTSAGVMLVHEVTIRDLRGDAAVGGFVVSGHDVSEHVGVVSRLEARYRDVVDAVGEIVFETDAMGRWSFVSPAWTAVTGFAAEESLGRSAHSFLASSRLTRPTAPADGSDDIAGLPEIVRCTTRAGGVRWLEVHARAVRDADGLVAGARGTLRDMTAWRAAEAALAEAKDEAERANRAKSEFLSRMSHELRTPMNSILGFSGLLQLEDLDAADRECVDHIVRAGRHLLELINEVLDIARIETDRVVFDMSDVAVAPIIGDAIQIVRPLADARGIKLTRDLDGAESVAVRADRQRLVQVLLNLLTNAVKYNRDHGSVVVRVLARPAGRARIEVEDTGPGIPDALRDRIFVPFDRLGAERGAEEGTGLGLPLSKGMVEGMGGSLGVASSAGIGTTFWMDLPAVGPIAGRAPSAERTTPEATSAGGRTILVVEDNPSNRALAGRVLARIDGLRVVEAEDGAAALRLARDLRPDLVLLDLGPPDISGEELLRRLRADPETCGVRVAVLSADATPERRGDLLAAGAVAYLTKPFDVAALVH